MHLEQKYLALLADAERRGQADQEGMRLCFQALSLAAAIDRDCARLLAPHGLSEGRFVLLFLLEAAPAGLAPAELAAQAGVSRATVTGLLDGLESQALVERQADANDRRALRIVLTRKGRALAKKLVGRHSSWIGGLFAALTGPEQLQLGRLLAKVSASLAEPHEALAP
ncbi:MarR family winged helix-turn-helix transcriptional regulator [Comamonas composti]|uniref:MarR family winged helix-turn-helix transcriptional regulator n=1 Tax=Comamonas composti TaxID=408558 RepID=UPI000407146C|nr:MarR family transcriptional regulator [Comamonas composti]